MAARLGSSVSDGAGAWAKRSRPACHESSAAPIMPSKRRSVAHTCRAMRAATEAASGGGTEHRADLRVDVAERARQRDLRGATACILVRRGDRKHRCCRAHEGQLARPALQAGLEQHALPDRPRDRVDVEEIAAHDEVLDDIEPVEVLAHVGSNHRVVGGRRRRSRLAGRARSQRESHRDERAHAPSSCTGRSSRARGAAHPLRGQPGCAPIGVLEARARGVAAARWSMRSALP